MISNRVLITGCSQGIGLALALEFARDGWGVIATARKSYRPALQAAATHFPSLRVIEMDVTDEADVAYAALTVAESDGALDVLVNNAAVFSGEGNEKLEALDLEWFEEAFATNVTGTVAVTRAFLPLLRRSHHPRIVNISSGAGSISEKDDWSYYPYSASKAALNIVTRMMAHEFAAEGIIVSAISPGWVHTQMGGPQAPVSPDDCAAALKKTITNLATTDSAKFLDRFGDASAYAW